MMRTLYKFLIKFFLIALLLIALSGGIALWSVGLFLPNMIENTFDDSTSFNLKIYSSKIRIWRGLFNFQNAVITNPSRFVSHDLAHIKKFKIDAAVSPRFLIYRDLSRLLLQDVVLEIDDIHWIKNPNGEVNIATLSKEIWNEIQNTQSSPETSQASNSKKTAKQKTPLPFISNFYFKLNTIYYEDYSNPGAPLIKKIPVNYERTFHNISDPKQIAVLISQDLMALGVNFLAQDLLNGLLNPQLILQNLNIDSTQIIDTSKKTLKSLSEGVTNGLQDVIGGLKNL